MMSLAQSLHSIQAAIEERRAQGLVLPDEYSCETCGKLDMSNPGVAAVVTKLGYAESQTLLCRCKEDRILRAKAQHRFANLPHEEPDQGPRSFERFKEMQGTEKGLEAALAFAKGEGPHILTLAGKVGRGKSYLLEAIGRQLLDDGVRVRYEFTPDLLKALRNSFSRDSLVDTSEIDARCSGAEVLLLDDVGAESTTPWTNERVTTFVDERYRSGRRLAVATNHTYGEMMARNSRLASRLFDTKTGSVKLAYMTGVDYRTGKQ